MLLSGEKLPQPIPTDKTIWQWLFDDALPNSPFNKGQLGGFRDARTDAFLSFDQVRQQATHLANALQAQAQLAPASHVVLFLHNSIAYPVVVFAALRLGCVVTASSPEYAVAEMAHVLEAADADLVFADRGSWGNVKEAVTVPGRIVLVGDRPADAPASIPSLDHLVQKGSALQACPPWLLPPNTPNTAVPAFLSFTSGTTSRPKGVLLSHHNVLAQLLQMRALTHRPPSSCPATLLAVLPFYHITGLVQLLQLPLVLNQHVVCMDRFGFDDMLRVLHRYRCDELWLVPPLLLRLVHDPRAANERLPHARQFNTGAAPLAPEIIAKLAARFPHVRLRQAWGMTESCSALTLSRPPHEQTYALAHTVGRPVPETTLQVVDPDTGRPLPRGASGEVLARGPQVAMGYHRNPAATAETFDPDGFLRTGDIGFIDAHGLLHIHDRRKEMVKVKGVAVAPAEIESLLLGHPAVADAAVIGVPDAYAGEVLKAFVVLKEGVVDAASTTTSSTTTIRDTLAAYVREHKSRPKWLAGGIVFLDAIPKSASGKVLRRVLKEGEEKAKAKL